MGISVSLFPNTTNVLGATNFKVGESAILPTPTEGQRAQWVFGVLQVINQLPKVLKVKLEDLEKVGSKYEPYITLDKGARDKYIEARIDFDCSDLKDFNLKNHDKLVALNTE